MMDSKKGRTKLQKSADVIKPGTDSTTRRHDGVVFAVDVDVDMVVMLETSSFPRMT